MGESDVCDRRTSARFTGCPVGCPLGSHDERCGVAGEFIPTDRTPCTGRCFTLSVEEHRHYGERYSGCPCTVQGAS